MKIKNSFQEYLGGFVVFLMVLGALFGAVVGAGVILSYPYFQAALNRSPLLLAWVVLMGTNAALSWAGVVPSLGVCVNGFVAAKNQGRHWKWLVSALVLILVVIVLGSFILTGFKLDVVWPLGDQQTWRMGITTVTILVPVLLAVFGMWMTAVQSEETFESPDHSSEENLPKPKGASKQAFSVENLSAYAALNEQLNGLLWFGGLVVSVGVLTTGTLRSAMIQGKYASNEAFPQALVLAYGLFFTLLLIVSYLPAYLIVHRAGNRLIREYTTGEAPMDWHEKRTKLKEALNLNGDFQETIKTAIAILAPLIASLVSLALPGSLD
jgi:hypothetical protein